MKFRNRSASGSGAWAPAYFAALSIAVWGPALFSSGYVLLGDMVFTPAMNPNFGLLGPPRGLMSVALVLNTAFALSRLVGAVALQKLLLFALVFLPGYLMFRNVPTRNTWAAVFAGTLYAINPYTYTRLLMGNWGLLLGYGLLPVVVASALKTFEAPSAERAARTALWLSLTAVASVHMGIIALGLSFLLWVFSLKRRVRTRALVASALLVAVLFLLLCSFFIVPALNSGSLTSRVGRADLAAFETRSSSSVGRAVSVLGMYGFWKLQLDALLPRKHVPLWPLFIALLLLLSIVGAAHAWAEPRRGPLVKTIVACAVVGFFLALGATAPVTGRLFGFLYDHISVVKLFREPQKFVALLVLAYSMLGAFGLERLLERRSRRPRRRQAWKGAAVALLILLVLFYGFRAFGGLWGQARAVEYPDSWSEAKEFLDREAGDSRVLFVPAYWYMRFDFTESDLTIASPLPTFFEQKNLVGVAIEVFGRQLNAGPLDRYLAVAFESARERGNLGAMLAVLDVEYVLFVQTPGSSTFSYVLSQEDLEVVRRWPDLVVLQNKVNVGGLVEARQRGTYRDLEDAARLARGGKLVGSYLRKGAETEIADAAGRVPDRYRISPRRASFVLTGAAEPGDSLLFSEPYDSDWRLNGRSARAQLGTTCAFPLPAGEGGAMTIVYMNPYIYLGYAASGLGLLLCVLFLAAGLAARRRAGMDGDEP